MFEVRVTVDRPQIHREGDCVMLFLFDENIPVVRQSLTHAITQSIQVVGESPSDTDIWKYARQNDAVNVYRDRIEAMA